MSSYQPIYDATIQALRCNVAGIIEGIARELFDISYLKADALSAIQKVEHEMSRPSVIFRPVLSLDGNTWIALYGDNIQVGVTGTGRSPDEAMCDFDLSWNRMPIPTLPKAGGK